MYILFTAECWINKKAGYLKSISLWYYKFYIRSMGNFRENFWKKTDKHFIPICCIGPIIAIIIFVVVVNYIDTNGYPWDYDKQNQEKIVSQVKPLISQSQSYEKTNYNIRKRVIIWNFEENTRNKAYDELPQERRGSSSDPAVTLILISDFRSQITGYYGGDKQKPAYRGDIELTLVNWPEKEILGHYHLISLPDESIYASPGAVTKHKYSPNDFSNL